jgi:5-methylcytosine-specific restriction endonuclease McrA
VSHQPGGRGHAWQSVAYATYRRVGKRDGFVCQECGCADHNELTLDHMHPLSKGGCKCWLNIQILCYACNTEKGATLPEPRPIPVMGAYPHTKKECGWRGEAP